MNCTMTPYSRRKLCSWEVRNLELTAAQKRDLLKALDRHKSGSSNGGLRTGKWLAKKGLVKPTIFLPYPSSWQWYAITEEGIELATSFVR